MAAADDVFDLVIVGASFAGLVAARTAAMRGLKVAVLDAKREAGHRVATTGILVKEAAEEIDVPHDLTRRVHGVRLYAPSHAHIDLFAPGYFFLTTDTPNLMRWLAREAERAGARLMWNTRFQGGGWQDGIYRLGGVPIGARYVLGADGGRSQVARAFGLDVNTRFLIGLETEYEGLDADSRFLHCFLDSDLAPGYIGWVAPGPCHAQVGLAVSHGRRAKLQPFIDRTRALFDYDAAQAVAHRSGRIPCGGLLDRWAGPGVMLVGDAAGMVSPATGGGIRYAFRYGRRAAQLIADHLQHLGPAPEYVMARELPSFMLKGAMRSALDVAPPNRLLSLALRSAPMRWLASHVYFHKRGSRGLTYAEFEARLAAMGREIPVEAGRPQREPA